MTFKERLQELDRLEKLATPGEWTVIRESCHSESTDIVVKDDVNDRLMTTCASDCDGNELANSDLTVALRNNARFLIDEGLKLVEENERLEARLKAFEFWEKCVYPDGMTAEQVQNELADYHFMMCEVPKVYCHVTNGRLSKTTYYAKTVCDEADNVLNDAIQREIDDLIESGELVRNEALSQGGQRWGALDNPVDACVQAEYILDGSLELFAHAVRAAEKEGLLVQSECWPPEPSDLKCDPQSSTYLFVAALRGVKQAYDVVAEWLPEPELPLPPINEETP